MVSFPSDELLQLAKQTTSSQDKFLANIDKLKQQCLRFFPKKEDFLKQRTKWDSLVFIPSIDDVATRDRVFDLWRKKGTKHRTNAAAENKELAEELKTFDKMFEDITNQIYGMPSNAKKRSRDLRDEWQLFETDRADTEFGIKLLKKLFPNAKTIFEPCCGYGAMANVLVEHGYSVISRDKHTHVSQFDVYKDHIEEEFDVIFTNPPWKDKAAFFKKLYEYVKEGKGFCVLLPSEAIDYDDVGRLIRVHGVEKHTRHPANLKFKDVHGVIRKTLKCSWFVGGSKVHCAKHLPTYLHYEGYGAK